MIRTRSLILGLAAPLLTLPLATAASAAEPAVPTTTSASAGESPSGLPMTSNSPAGAGTEDIRDLQQRLDWLGMQPGPLSGMPTPETEKAIRRFQTKFMLPVSGKATARTTALLKKLTPTGEAIDPRCQAPGKVICLDKTQKLLRAYEDGKLMRTTDARFGGGGMGTREGTFKVESKDRNHVSRLYHSKMPYAMFFSGGQAVHYSSDFAARGYNGYSHGCVNIRSTADVAWVFDWAQVGTQVVVYRSVAK